MNELEEQLLRGQLAQKQFTDIVLSPREGGLGKLVASFRARRQANRNEALIEALAEKRREKRERILEQLPEESRAIAQELPTEVSQNILSRQLERQLLPERISPLSPEGKRQEDIRRGFVTSQQIAQTQAIEQRAEFQKEQAKVLGKARGEDINKLQNFESNFPELLQTTDKLKELAPVATFTAGQKTIDFARRQITGQPSEGAVARAEFDSTVKNVIFPLLNKTFKGTISDSERKALKGTLADINLSPSEKMVQIDSFVAQKTNEIKSLRRKLGVVGGLPGLATGAGISFATEAGLGALDARTAKVPQQTQQTEAIGEPTIEDIEAELIRKRDELRGQRGLADIPTEELQTILKSKKRQKAQENLTRLREEQELETFGAKNILRDVGEMIPFVGGFIDNVEAFARSRGSGKEYREELRKVRENQRRFGQLVKEQGLDTARKIGKITGSIGAGLAVPTLGKGRLAKAGFATLEGAIEGAGFADDQAKAGALVGGALGGTIQTLAGFLPTRTVNEVAESAGDIRELASNNKTMNLLIKGVDSSQRVANNVGEVVEEALRRPSEEVSKELRKIVDLDNATNDAFRNFMKKKGSTVLSEEGIKKLNNLDLVPRGRNAISDALQEATQDTGSFNLDLNNLNQAKRVLDDLIQENVTSGQQARNISLIKAKNALNDIIREDSSFRGFKEIQAQRARAFQLRDAYKQGFEFSPTIKRETLKVFDELTGKRKPFSKWTPEVKRAFLDGRNEKRIITNLKTLATKARNKSQARGSLSSILKQNITRRGAIAPVVGGAVGGLPGLATGAGISFATEAGLGALDARTANLLLSKQTPKVFRDTALSTILARGAGKKLGER
jgi:hypothetical protein